MKASSLTPSLTESQKGLPGQTVASVGEISFPVVGCINDQDHSNSGSIIRNWSGTQVIAPKRVVTPSSQREIERFVGHAQRTRQKFRALGSAFSPNGLPFSLNCVLSTEAMCKIHSVDPLTKVVHAEAGVRLDDLSKVLRSYGLSLPVIPSVNRLTLGGYLQSGVHSTGATIPPADAFLREMTLVTPGRGTLSLSHDGSTGDPDGSIFSLAAVGLGSLGVTSDVKIRCDKARWLVETTSVWTRSEAAEKLPSLLKSYRHVRYMWLPFVDAVVVVTHHEAPPGEPYDENQATVPPPKSSHLISLVPAARRIRGWTSRQSPPVESLPHGLLRQWLISSAPLDPQWIKRVNIAEAMHWSDSAVRRTGWSEDLLNFDCGGPQWVAEIAFHAGSLSSPSTANCDLVLELMTAIESHNIPAPAPVEQRWSCGSPSAMSPVAGTSDDLYSWVGVVMYVPDSDSPTATHDVRRAFDFYSSMLTDDIGPRYHATEHWAKIECNSIKLPEKQRLLRESYPIDQWARVRSLLDPHHLMTNSLIEHLIAEEQCSGPS